ncbi:MAG: HTH domain-containing protein [Phycisphaerales bacterium]
MPSRASPPAPSAALARRLGRSQGPQAQALSRLDAAATVLAASDVPMRAKEMIAAMETRAVEVAGRPDPEATLYAAIIREIAAKGAQARFKKHERGVFVATKHAGATGGRAPGGA